MRREGAEWKQIFQIIDAACADYLTGMATLGSASWTTL